MALHLPTSKWHHKTAERVKLSSASACQTIRLVCFSGLRAALRCRLFFLAQSPCHRSFLAPTAPWHCPRHVVLITRPRSLLLLIACFAERAQEDVSQQKGIVNLQQQCVTSGSRTPSAVFMAFISNDGWRVIILFPLSVSSILISFQQSI